MKRLFLSLLAIWFLAFSASAQDVDSFPPPKRVSYVTSLEGYQPYGRSVGSWLIVVEFRDGHEPSTFVLLVGEERYNETLLGDRYHFYYGVNAKLIAVTGPHR